MLTFKKTITAVVAVAAAAALGTTAQAAHLVTGVYNTGVDDSGNVLANGVVDSHYTVTASTLAGYVAPGPAYATTYTAWLANSPASKWITPFVNDDGTAKSGGTNNTVWDYTLSFNVGSSIPLSSLSISGNVASDNYVEIFLNGNYIGGQAPVPSPGIVSYFRNFTAFGTNGFFNSGSNDLTFRVTQFRVVTGLNVTDLAIAQVPEPATWAMMISGFFLVSTQLRRRRKMTSVTA